MKKCDITFLIENNKIIFKNEELNENEEENLLSLFSKDKIIRLESKKGLIAFIRPTKLQGIIIDESFDPHEGYIRDVD